MLVSEVDEPNTSLQPMVDYSSERANSCDQQWLIQVRTFVQKYFVALAWILNPQISSQHLTIVFKSATSFVPSPWYRKVLQHWKCLCWWFVGFYNATVKLLSLTNLVACRLVKDRSVSVVLYSLGKYCLNYHLCKHTLDETYTIINNGFCVVERACYCLKRICIKMKCSH